MQILIEQRLRTAIEQNKPDEIKALAAFPGFETVLQRVLDLSANGDIADPAYVMNAAALLDALNPPSQPWVRFAWSSIRAAFQKPTSWQKLREEDAVSFAGLMAHCDAQQGKDMLATLATKLAAINEAITGQPGFANYFTAICLGASKAAAEAKLELPEIVVPGPEDLFLNVLAACASDAALPKVLSTKSSNDQLVSKLSADLSDPATTLQVEAKVRALFGHKPTMPWGNFLDTARQVIQDQDVAFAGFLPALECLGLLSRSEKDAELRIKALLDSGSLVAKLHLAQSQKRLEIEARLLALLLLDSQNFDPPNGQAWQTLLEDRAELSGMTDKALLEFDGPDNFPVLVEHSKTNPSALVLIRAIVSLRIRENRIGALKISDVIGQLPQYLTCVEDDLRNQFVRAMADYELFWEGIEAAIFDANVILILGELIKSGSGHDGKARQILEKKLKVVTGEGWTAALETGQDPLPIAMRLSEETVKAFHLGTVLSDVLENAITPLLANNNSAFRARWFRSLDLVSPSSRVTLLKSVRDRIVLGTEVAVLPEFLREGSDALLADGEFVDEADGAVRYVVLRLLDSNEGLSWLVDMATTLQSWVTRSSIDTKNVLGERLSELYSSADDASKVQLDKLADEWSFNLDVEDSKKTEGAETRS